MSGTQPDQRTPDGSGIAEALKAIAANRDSETRLRILTEWFGRGIGARAALVAVSADGDAPVVVRAMWLAEGAVEGATSPVDEETLIRMFGAGGPSLERLTTRSVWEWDARSDEGSWGLAIPVRPEGSASAGLFAAFDDEPPDRATAIRHASEYTPLATLCVRHAIELDRMSELARLDSLTGCLNRATILASLEAEIKRSARREYPLAVCYLDLDGFKAVNDEHGHAQGDHVLSEVGEALRGATRRYDLVGRIGGDEFLVVMPETELAEGVEIAERLAAGIQIRTAADGGLVNASYGVVMCPEGGEVARVIALADAQMMATKEREPVRVKADEV